MAFSIQQLAEEARLSGLKYRLLSDGRHCIYEYMLPKIQTTKKINILYNDTVAHLLSDGRH